MNTTDDPLAGVIEDAPPAEPIIEGDPAPQPDPDTVNVSRAEWDRMRETARSIEGIAPYMDDIRNAIVSGSFSGQQRQQQPTQQEIQSDPNLDQSFYQSPSAATRQVARQEVADAIAQQVAPREAALNAKIAALAIQNFKSNKGNDPFYAAVSPIFDDLVKQSMSVLGMGDPMVIDQQLTHLWRASVGTYTETRAAQVRRDKAKQISAGAGAPGGGAPGRGGGANKPHLRDVDDKAFRDAVAAGMTEEDMAAIVAELDLE